MLDPTDNAIQYVRLYHKVNRLIQAFESTQKAYKSSANGSYSHNLDKLDQEIANIKTALISPVEAVVEPERKLCICLQEPSGNYGLEGYQKDLTYHYELLPKDKNNRPYYRVYPTKEWDDYYETCSVQTFKKYFEEID